MNFQNLRRRFYKISWILLAAAVIIFIIDYICFHYITDSGFTAVKQEEAGKPLVTFLIGVFGAFCAFGSLFSFLFGKIFAAPPVEEKRPEPEAAEISAEAETV